MGISRKPFSPSEKSKKITKLSPSTANHDQLLMAARPSRRTAMDAGEWRTFLNPGSRQRIVNKIFDTIQKHITLPGDEVRRIAARFEDRIYIAAASQSDYLRKISLKMLSLERSQNAMANSSRSNNAGSSNGLPGPAWKTNVQIFKSKKSDSRQIVS